MAPKMAPKCTHLPPDIAPDVQGPRWINHPFFFTTVITFQKTISA